MPTPNFSGTLNTIGNAGIWSGLANGLQQGLMAYKDESGRQTDRADKLRKEAEEKALKDRSYQLDLAKGGLEETKGQDGAVTFSPSKVWEAKKNADEQRAEALKKSDRRGDLQTRLMLQGQVADYDGDGNPVRYRQVPGFLDMNQLHKDRSQSNEHKNRMAEIKASLAGKHSNTMEEIDASLEGKHKNAMEEIGAKKASMAGKGGTSMGKPLNPATVLKVNEGNAIPRTLEDLKTEITNNKDLFGPVAGRWATANPWGEKAQTLQSSLKTAAQQVGRFMEGGVLRKEDEVKYEKMLSQLTESPDIALNKLQIVDRMIKRKQASDIAALAAAGYNISGLEGAGEAPTIPSVLNGKRPGLMGASQTAPAPAAAEVAQGPQGTKVINGVTYQKVPGGWSPVEGR